MLVIYDIKLKSGFFKTENYSLEIEQEKLNLVSKQTGRKITFYENDITSISIIKSHPLQIQIEISTNKEIYSVYFQPETDCDNLIVSLRHRINTKICIE